MRRAIGWALPLLVLLVVPALRAQDEPENKPPPDEPKTAEEQYQALEAEFNTAQREFSKAYGEAKTDEERQKIVNEKYPRPEQFAGRFLELAEKHPDDPVAVNALVWVVTRARNGDEAAKALEVLARDHIKSDQLGQVCQSLVYSSSLAAEKLLRSALENSPHHEVQGQACFSLAQFLKQQADLVASLKSDSAQAERFEQFYGKDYLEHLTGLDPDQVSQEAERLFEQVIESYGDIRHYRGTLADASTGALFELRNLAIGNVAPEIEGEDIDAQPFKLSDYRGKVVVLDFWGNW